jgi:2-keto-4-pentenoate hydratase/2-oxohepta-3-ene-1,7-dioic acid hydratase in catechol pathway
MKLAQFKTRSSDDLRVGVLRGDTLVDVTDAAPDMATVIRGGRATLQSLEGRTARAAYALDAVEYLPPVYPSKIMAIGRNYFDHAAEGGSEPPPAPLLFAKLANSLTAHNAPIELPEISTQVDFEAELAVVIGRRARRVSEADALDHVFGYSLIHDVSARDLQFADGQWIRGKSLDTFAPLGPFITTSDEIENVQALKIEGILNGQVMQSSNTSKMIFKVSYLIHYLSQAITLEPGDVIATGTPEGVGIFRKPPVLLKPGDVFEVVIEKLGVLRNPVVSAPRPS